MPYVITAECTKDGNCVDVCPVDCIAEGDDQFFINPEECTDCGVCSDECPVDAIFADDELPEDKAEFVKKNAKFFED